MVTEEAPLKSGQSLGYRLSSDFFMLKETFTQKKTLDSFCFVFISQFYFMIVLQKSAQDYKIMNLVEAQGYSVIRNGYSRCGVQCIRLQHMAL